MIGFCHISQICVINRLFSSLYTHFPSNSCEMYLHGFCFMICIYCCRNGGNLVNFLIGLLYELSVFDMSFRGFCVSELFLGECLQNVLIGFFMPVQM